MHDCWSNQLWNVQSSFLSYPSFSLHATVVLRLWMRRLHASSKLRFSALCCCKQRLVLCLIVSLGMVLFVSMPTDDAFVVAVLGVTKFTTRDGGAPTIAVYPEPNCQDLRRRRLNRPWPRFWDERDATIEPSLTTILVRFRCHNIFFFVLSIQFRYVSYSIRSSRSNHPAHFIASSVHVPRSRSHRYVGRGDTE